ncbi:uncharacterized protein BX663DRAFT_533045 [Cokeromyces recurvatus]|uniref:uncharacterized protein n=1 Tax=Cokeromyces recurvatus TaxID=90255 RepID=UPI00221EF4A4|nr:uncharacterized protein BX663DRAFT_533045 [Cokeromyces recurvatus]KAI7898991.1 hypothetical protein BX663DRAFT_533045 [Cokeromyces recurvatus]
MACCQCIIIVALQASICYLNTYQAHLLPEPTTDNVLIRASTSDDLIPIQAADRLGRIKWENIAFIGFQFWFLGMAFDATVYQNTAEILALAVLNVVCAILGALQVVDGVKWLNRLILTSYPVYPLSMAEKIEITLSVITMSFAIIMSFLSYQMSKQFGWNIYKKIGADVQIQRMYRIFQFFVLSLKIDIFTQFMVSVFYLIQFAMKQGIMWETIIQVVVTVFSIPMLYFARTAGSTESKVRMCIFITFECIALFHFALIFSQTLQPNNNWYTWITLIWIGVAVTLCTCILGYICMRNFGKGLKPFVQRGSVKTRMDIENNFINKKANESWVIDED